MYDINIEDSRFEWDEAKNHSNIRKHGVSFNEARTVFFDKNAIRSFDPDHSEEEDRFILLGLSRKGRVLFVCHSYRGEPYVIRIISARKVEKGEVEDYWRIIHEGTL